MSSRSAIYLIGISGVLVAVVVGALLYTIGAGNAPDKADALTYRQAGYRQAYPAAKATAYRSSRAAALVKGEHLGRVRGRTLGRRAGTAAGTKKRKAVERARARKRELAAAAARAEQAAAAQRAAEEKAANETGSFGGCNVPLFVDGYCPSDAEIQQESEAESNAGFPPGD